MIRSYLLNLFNRLSPLGSRNWGLPSQLFWYIRPSRKLCSCRESNNILTMSCLFRSNQLTSRARTLKICHTLRGVKQLCGKASRVWHEGGAQITTIWGWFGTSMCLPNPSTWICMLSKLIVLYTTFNQD